MAVICIFPDGAGKKYDSLPKIEDLDKKYSKYRWVFSRKNSMGDDVYKLITGPAPTFTITFADCVGGPITVSNNEFSKMQEYPQPLPREGYTATWSFNQIEGKDVTIRPVYTPIYYTATFIDASGSRSFKFRSGGKLNVPPVSWKKNYISTWEPFTIKDADFEVHAVYKPYKIFFAYDGKIDVQFSDNCHPPHLEPRDGYRRYWEFPPGPINQDIHLTPKLSKIWYNLLFHYPDEEYPVKCKFNLHTPPRIPDPPRKPGFKCHWSEYDIHRPANQDVYLLFKPIKLTLHHLDGSTEVFEYDPDDTLLKDYIETFTDRRFRPKCENMDLYPAFSITFHFPDGEPDIYDTFNQNDMPNFPEIPEKPGFRGKWVGFDFSRLRDQDAYISYAPILREKEIPEIRETHKPDIEERPDPEVKFALFFVDSELRFIVPYDDDDTHYLDEVRYGNTVPKSIWHYGTWKEVEPYEDMLTYVADYSKPAPDVPRDTTSFEWDINKISDYIYENDDVIILNDVKIHLFSTKFSEITGIYEKELPERCSLCLKNWLRREGIPFKDGIDRFGGPKYTIKEKSNGSLQMGVYGQFMIGYTPDFDDALSFLEENDIFFKDYVKTEKFVQGYPAKHLPYTVDLLDDSPSEIAKAKEDIYPINKPIPSRIPIKKIRYTPNILPTVTTEQIKGAMVRNDKVIKTFNTNYCPECEFDIVEGEIPAVIIKEYNGNANNYDIPTFVTLDDGHDYRVIGIGDNAFARIDSLRRVSLPDSIRTIGERAFFRCRNLISINMPDELRTIGDQAFNGCRLTEVELPAGVESVGRHVFSGIEQLTILCDRSALSPESVPGMCEIIEKQPEEKPVAVTSSEENSDDDFASFFDSLKPYQKDYLRAIITDGDIKIVVSEAGKGATTIELEINEQLSDKLEDDDGLVEDGEISEDYEDEIRQLIED